MRLFNLNGYHISNFKAFLSFRFSFCLLDHLFIVGKLIGDYFLPLCLPVIIKLTGRL